MQSVGKADYPERSNSSTKKNKRSGTSVRRRFSTSRSRLRDGEDNAEFLGVSASRAERIWKRLFYGLFVAAFTYGMITGGYINYSLGLLTDKIDSLIRDAGFAITKVQVTGQKRVTDTELMKALNVEQVSMLRFNTGDARERIEDLEWVASARVMRFFPGTVKVVLEERTPFALWQTRGQYFLVDTKGVVIKEEKILTPEHKMLSPLVVGDGADSAVKKLFGELNKYKSLMKRLKAAVRVARRRWTLRLRNGVDILLPEEQMAGALSELDKLQKRYHILSGSIGRIDMRIPDRITLRRLKKKGAVAAPAQEQKSYSQMHLKRSGA